MRSRKWYDMVGCLGILVLLVGFLWGLSPKTARAAGVNVSIETESATLVRGEEFYVVITITSSEEMSGFEGYFTYNQSVMKFITGGSVSSGNDDVFSIRDTGRKEGTTKLKYSIKFKARKAGSSSITLSAPYTVYAYEDSSAMSVAYNTLNVLVLTRKQAERRQQFENGGSSESAGGDKKDTSEAASKPEKDDGEGEDAFRQPVKTLEQEKSAASTQQALLADAGQQPGEEEGDGSVSMETTDTESIGLDQKTCVMVILLAALGLLLLGGMAVWRYRKEVSWLEEDEEGEYYEEEENLVQDEEPGQDEDIPEEKEESLEEIERRLEGKRRWLRKE